LIADKINLNDVRFGGCTFALVPEPGSAAIALLAGATTVVRRRRR
jgi:hypothetical protein